MRFLLRECPPPSIRNPAQTEVAYFAWVLQPAMHEQAIETEWRIGRQQNRLAATPGISQPGF